MSFHFIDFAEECWSIPPPPGTIQLWMTPILPWSKMSKMIAIQS
jgi:hypothetical protein